MGSLHIGRYGREALGPSRGQMRTRNDSEYSSNVDYIAIWASLVAARGARVVGCWWQRVTLSDLVAIAK